MDNKDKIINRVLLMMKYDNSKTLSENTLVIHEQNKFKPEETFGKCLNKLTFTPYSTGTYNKNDSVSKKLNKWAKSIGESFSYQLYQQSGWNSKKFNEHFTKCNGNKLSINGTFKQDLERFKKDSPSLPNSPYFCYNQAATQNRWNAPMDNDLGTPNYVSELTNTFGTLDTCTIFGMLSEIPKFDWDAADKKDWENVLLGKEGFKKLFKKVNNANTSNKYNKLIQSEKDVLKEMIKNKDWAISKASSVVKKTTIYQLSKLISLEQLLKIVYKYVKFSKKNPFKDILIKIGGVWYSFDKLADIYGIKNVETRNPTQIQKIEKQITPEVIENTLEEIDLKVDDQEYNNIIKELEKKYGTKR
jgi:hypothetical protein